MLNEFGLTTLQAKIYLILLQLERADVKAVARSANLARQEIYRVMPSLLRLGLAQKIVSKPLQYEATPLDEGLMILLQTKKEKVDELEQEKKWLIENLQITHNRAGPNEDDPQLIVFNETSIWFSLYRKIIERTRETIDILLPVITVPSRFHLLWKEAEEYLTAGQPLKIRLIIQLSNCVDQPPKSITKHNFFVTKCLKEAIPFGMHIYDRKEFTMSISAKNGLPSLWSNNPNMVIVAQNNFEYLWNKAKKIDAIEKQIVVS